MARYDWTKERFEGSVSFRCVEIREMDIWPSFASDTEMAAIVEAEAAISPVPGWAREIVDLAIKWPPLWCPHYLFPQPFLDVVSSIGKQQPSFVHGCYTVARERKERLRDYIFCLDAWLGGATAEDASVELAFRNRGGPNWKEVCNTLWDILGERDELKELLLQRMLHRQRWWLKTSIWNDDLRDTYCCDQYLGNIAGTGDSYGNPDFCDPYFTELEAPRVKAMKARLDESHPDWQGTWGAIEHSHLCAPKAFRFLERLIWFIGQGIPYSKEKKGITSFLQCEDTYPDPSGFRDRGQHLLAAFRGVAMGKSPSDEIGQEVQRRIGEPTPIKAWLLRLFVHKLELHAATFQQHD